MKMNAIILIVVAIAQYILVCDAVVLSKQDNLLCAAQFKCQCSVSDQIISCDYGTTETTMKATFNSSVVRVVETFNIMNSINITKLDNYFSRNVIYLNFLNFRCSIINLSISSFNSVIGQRLSLSLS